MLKSNRPSLNAFVSRNPDKIRRSYHLRQAERNQQGCKTDVHGWSNAGRPVPGNVVQNTIEQTTPHIISKCWN
jgi:hypothetical protein